MAYDYIAAGITIVNDIVYPDGRTVSNVPGGSVYAWSGIACYTDSVLFSTTGGPDFKDIYGSYFEENGVSAEGFNLTMPATHHTVLRYEQDGRWKEESLYGWDYFDRQKYNSMTKASELLPFLWEGTKGLYLDALADDGIFAEMDLLREKAPHMKVMWEPPTQSSTSPMLREKVMENIMKADMYSMNLHEASVFFAAESRAEVLEGIDRLGKPCLLREGEDGATWCSGNGHWHLAAYDTSAGVYPTGCGNCSTAACLWAVCEGLSGYEVTAAANAAAQLNAQVLGPMAVGRLRASGAARLMAAELLGRI